MTESDERKLLGVAVGNSRTRVGLLIGKGVEGAVSFDNGDMLALSELVRSRAVDERPEAIVIASVNGPVADSLQASLGESDVGVDVLRLGRDLPIQVEHTLDDLSTVGQDRLLCALGAHAMTGRACVVVDAGTAITVDFVDGEGTFHGGAIAPGLGMMLRVMHERTAALPLLMPARPEASRGVLGKDTAHAMQLGVRAAARGMVRLLLEEYAEMFGAYPCLIATGGDATSLFEGDELVEAIVLDLQLLGVAEACRTALASEGGDEG